MFTDAGQVLRVWILPDFASVSPALRPTVEPVGLFVALASD
jgi:hypothetical protein